MLGLACWWAVTPPTAAAPANGNSNVPPKLPTEDFSLYTMVGGAALSSDGKTIAVQAVKDGVWTFFVNDWETGKTLVSENKAADDGTPIWISDDIVSNGAGALDRTGKRTQLWGLGGRRFFAARFSGAGADEGVFIDARRDVKAPDVFRENATTGVETMVAENPGRVFEWLVDGAGRVTVAVQWDKDEGQSRIIHRVDEKSPWLVPAGLGYSKDQLRAQWLSADGNLLYISKVTPEGTWGLYSYDLIKNEIKEAILSHTKYDILPNGGPAMAPRTREILGFHYMTDKLRAIWFDPQMAAVQAALDQGLPNRINLISSLSDDLQRMIVFSTSPRDPGTYYRFDLAKKELKPLYPVLPWIKPAQMAENYPISYGARDGLTIHGYLTLPLGRAPKNLPLVVFPHAGTWDRDTWKFDLDVQFLANRGYAVLQVNYRGSSGYGRDFQEKAFRRVGRDVQDDITDGTHWAIAQGVADPARIAILGFGFGGYSALMGAAQDPRLYCCAISISGTTNWALKKKIVANYELFKTRYGDPEKDVVELMDISPVNHADRINCPLLLIYDTNEDNYLAVRDDFNAFTKALDKAHKPYEKIDKHNEFTGVYSRKNRVEMLNRIDKFLADHMPSDVSGQAVAAAAK